MSLAPVNRADADGHEDKGTKAAQNTVPCGPGGSSQSECAPNASGTTEQNKQSATSQGAKGLGKILLGIGLVAAAAAGDVPGGVAGALILTSAVIGGTATAVSGTADVLGAATKT